jgi:ABC-type uncharacterized transport system substrate-binding protein
VAGPDESISAGTTGIWLEYRAQHSTRCRWTGPNAAKIRQQAAELVALAPDVIFATGGSVMAPLQQATRTLPIVFVQVPDPVAAGFVDSLARPGGNATGFTQFEYSQGAKLLELLKEMSSRVTRAIVLRDAGSPDGIGQFAAIQAVGPSLGVELRPIGVRDPGEIERAITTIAGGRDSGLIVTASGSSILHRELIIALAARHRLLAVYPYRFFVIGGGLISYGPSSIDPYRRAAAYVERILKGEKPGDLPIQQATKFELVINLKTAKELGLDPPISLLARTDEVIE